MPDYHAALYFAPLLPGCARARRAVVRSELDAELRNVLLSGRHLRELVQTSGRISVPCLVVSRTVVRGADEIEKFLRLRYGG